MKIQLPEEGGSCGFNKRNVLNGGVGNPNG